LVTRLRSEAANAEKVHATRTALIAARDAEVKRLAAALAESEATAKGRAEELASEKLARGGLEDALAKGRERWAADEKRLAAERDEARAAAAKEVGR
jgi:hypothetical protein